MPIALPPELENTDDAALEEWFLAHLQDDVIPFESSLAILRLFQSRSQGEKAETCADLLHDALFARGKDRSRAEEQLLSLWELKAEWHAVDPAFPAVCKNKLDAYFQGNSRMEVCIRSAGFNANLPARECLRRLRVLRALQPETLCYEKTWGFGIVSEIAEFTRQVRIDFEKKKRHWMSLAYAAESLQLLGDDHLLAICHRDPEGIADWVRKDPAGVVKSALQSFGPLNTEKLQELLTGRIVPSEGWKNFWGTARKRLKEDPLVEFPTKRNEAIRLLDRAKAYDEEWLNTLAVERDLDKILKVIEDWKSSVSPSTADAVPQVIRNRLDFVIHGADKFQTATRAQALFLADELGVVTNIQEFAGHSAALLMPKTIVDAVNQLPVALIERLLSFIRRRDPEQTIVSLLQSLPQLALSPFNEVVAFLRKNGAEIKVVETLRPLLVAGDATPEMVYWLCRNVEFTREHSIGDMGRLVLEALNAAETTNITGERLKAKNQLRALLEQADWLPAALSAMQDMESHHIISRLKRSTAWSAAERQMLLNRLAAALPELKSILAEKAPAVAKRLTSLRSYQERQQQLHKLITEDIPRNIQDIGVARSYGDLRENFEYKTAREAQGILMRRRYDLEKMLGEVISTDFEGFQTATAGMCTSVSIAHADGHREEYFILGEWDSDESLGIISCKSKLAEAFSGHKPGDQIVIPTENGSTTVTVMEVGGPSDAIKRWIRGG